MAAANKKLVQQVFADSASRSGTTFADNLAEDASWVVTGQYSWSHEFRGREAIQHGLMGHFRSFFEQRPRTLAFNFMAEAGGGPKPLSSAAAGSRRDRGDRFRSRPLRRLAVGLS